MNLSPVNRSTLAKVLGLLGSSHDGEVLAAARKAQQLLHEHDTTWPGILGLDDMQAPEPSHIALAHELLGRGKGICTDWEMRFLRGVLSFKTISANQQQTLAAIREKVDATNVAS